MARGIITVKYLEELGIDKEIAQQIFAERGREIAEMNAEKAELEKQLSAVQENYEALNTELETLKQSNASGEEWKSKFETLQAETAEKERQSLAEKEEAERKASIKQRFEAVTQGKTFYNEPTKEYYLNKFSEAISNGEFEGVGDKDLIHSLTKDDATAFKGVEVMSLAGGNNASNLKTKRTVRDIMSDKKLTREQRRQEIAENISKGTLDYGSRN